MIEFLQVRRNARTTQVSYTDKTPPGKHLERPCVIPVFLPQHGCPHQCVFCNQYAITDTRQEFDARTMLPTIVDRFLKNRPRRERIIQIAFYGGNFLGLRPARLRQHLDGAAAYVRRGAVDSLRFSTRPDTISPATLALIRAYPVRTVELGVQSMDDRVLSAARRGHRATDTSRAVAQLSACGYEIGLQIMTGLPGDTPARAMATVEAVIDLKPAFVRIYPTLVLAGSRLATDYHAGRYHPPGLAGSLDLVARLWMRLMAAGIRVIRMGLQDSPALADRAMRLAGPYHPAFGEQVRGRIFRAMAAAALNNARPATGHVMLKVHPRRVSVMTGPHRQNLVQLQKTYRLDGIRVAADQTLGHNQLEVDNRQFHIASSP